MAFIPNGSIRLTAGDVTDRLGSFPKVSGGLPNWSVFLPRAPKIHPTGQATFPIATEVYPTGQSLCRRAPEIRSTGQAALYRGM